MHYELKFVCHGLANLISIRRKREASVAFFGQISTMIEYRDVSATIMDTKSNKLYHILMVASP